MNVTVAVHRWRYDTALPHIEDLAVTGRPVDAPLGVAVACCWETCGAGWVATVEKAAA